MCGSHDDTLREDRRFMRMGHVHGLPFLEMRSSGYRTPKLLVRSLSTNATATCFKEHLEHAGLGAHNFTLHSFSVSGAVTQTIAGKDIVKTMASVNWKLAKECTPVRGRRINYAWSRRDYTRRRGGSLHSDKRAGGFCGPCNAGPLIEVSGVERVLCGRGGAVLELVDAGRAHRRHMHGTLFYCRFFVLHIIGILS